MIRFKKENILEELKELGYTTYKIRNDKLLSEGVLTKLRGKNANITLDTLDTLCSLLDCDIDDIIEYVPDWTIPKKRNPKT